MPFTREFLKGIVSRCTAHQLANGGGNSRTAGGEAALPRRSKRRNNESLIAKSDAALHSRIRVVEIFSPKNGESNAFPACNVRSICEAIRALKYFRLRPCNFISSNLIAGARFLIFDVEGMVASTRAVNKFANKRSDVFALWTFVINRARRKNEGAERGLGSRWLKAVTTVSLPPFLRSSTISHSVPTFFSTTLLPPSPLSRSIFHLTFSLLPLIRHARSRTLNYSRMLQRSLTRRKNCPNEEKVKCERLVFRNITHAPLTRPRDDLFFSPSRKTEKRIFRADSSEINAHFPRTIRARFMSAGFRERFKLIWGNNLARAGNIGGREEKTKKKKECVAHSQFLRAAADRAPRVRPYFCARVNISLYLI